MKVICLMSGGTVGGVVVVNDDQNPKDLAAQILDNDVEGDLRVVLKTPISVEEAIEYARNV